ncbi:MAG TPA: PEP-utilizing enzyme [Solirubrobacterales bacterium]|nr:PEP-utilizing enzyme [Solirubrobacterales bacterium]
MGEHYGYRDAWPRDPQTPIVAAFHEAIRKLAEERFEASGKSWEEAVHDRTLQLRREDFEKIEAGLLATGYRFEASATVTYEEAPEKHKPLADLEDSGEQEIDEAGRRIVGSGDNVFATPQDLEGIARHVHTVDKVMEWLTEGVPEETIAVIDDCGGTLTAPILGEFKAVVCMGGTVRSHLGILTREYNVPCLMNATIDGLRDGSRIAVEYSRPAADAYADEEKAAAQRSRIYELGTA